MHDRCLGKAMVLLFLLKLLHHMALVATVSDENFPEKFKSENFPFFYKDSWYG
jgi:Na+-transporting methylmalonyl-CoA/oxaloacetate decarboxylase gamma subunit